MYANIPYMDPMGVNGWNIGSKRIAQLVMDYGFSEQPHHLKQQSQVFGCFLKWWVFHYFHHPFWGTLIFGNTHLRKKIGWKPRRKQLFVGSKRTCWSIWLEVPLRISMSILPSGGLMMIYHDTEQNITSNKSKFLTC